MLLIKRGARRETSDEIGASHGLGGRSFFVCFVKKKILQTGEPGAVAGLGGGPRRNSIYLREGSGGGGPEVEKRRLFLPMGGLGAVGPGFRV